MVVSPAIRFRRRSVALRMLALAPLLMLVACAPRAVLYPDADGFDFDTFEQSPTVLGGVANLAHDVDAGLESPEQITALMEATFMKARPDLRFVRSSVLRERIGEAGYINVLGRYLDHADLGASMCARLSAAMGADARYLALARIDEVEVSHGEQSQDRDGDSRTDNEDVTKSTERKVWMTFSLFDLQTGREILTDERVEGATAELTFREAPGPGIYGVPEGGAWVLGSKEPDYPPPPPMHDAIGDALRYFAKRIPSR